MFQYPYILYMNLTGTSEGVSQQNNHFQSIVVVTCGFPLHLKATQHLGLLSDLVLTVILQSN